MSKHTFYFSHDYSARNDLKMQKMFKNLGHQGIGLYWCLVELLYEHEGYLPNDTEQLGFILRCPDNDLEILKSLINDFDLFKFNENGDIYSSSVLERMSIRDEKSEARRNAANERWKNANAMQVHNKRNASALHCNAIKGKERKEKEIKEKTTTTTTTALAVSDKNLAPAPHSDFADFEGFARDKRFVKEYETLLKTWETAYSAVHDVKGEIRKAYAWERANPSHKKTNIARFLNNWLARTNDNANRGRASPPQQQFKSRAEIELKKLGDHYAAAIKTREEQKNATGKWTTNAKSVENSGGIDEDGFD